MNRGPRTMALRWCVITVCLLGRAMISPAAEGPVGPPPDWDLDVVRSIPVQFNGRVAPFDTLARVYVRKITGTADWEDQDPVAVVLNWATQPQNWVNSPLVRIDDEGMLRGVGLDPAKRHFSLIAISECDPLQRLIGSAIRQAESGRRLEGPALEAYELTERVTLLRQCLRATELPFVPNPLDPEAAWVGFPRSADDPRLAGVARAWEDASGAFRAGDARAFAAAAEDLAKRLREFAGGRYPPAWKIDVELLYNRLQPFVVSMWIMACAFVGGLAGGWRRKSRAAMTGSVGLMLLACISWAAGMAIRWVISGRAPVSNMYESLVMLSGGVSVVGLILTLLLRQRVLLVVAAALTTVGLALSHWLPLDPDIDPLAPALRGTMWLTIHVCTIILAYAAATLAMGLGHIQLGGYLLGRPPGRASRRLSHLIYRSVQLAVALLTTGIIFGAMWANSAWGRYWGWDPKETWALITLLGYVCLLHARSAGWLREFGVAAVAVLAFQLVMMTYYGVNFVLGMGLHSYAFGSGGQAWALAFLCVECIFVLVTAGRRPRDSHN